MSEPPPTPPPRLSLRRVAAAVALGVGGVGVIWLVTWVVGWGRDLHAPRLLAAGAVLFIAGLVVVGRPASREMRVLALGLGITGAVALWCRLPCRAGGPNLLDAVAQHDALAMRMAPDSLDEARSAKGLRDGVDGLAADYPSLAAGLGPQLDRWADGAAGQLADQFRDLSLDDPRSARTLQTRAAGFTAAFPKYKEAIDEAGKDWVARSLAFRVDELTKLDPADWAGFQRTAPRRRALADAFPACRTPLIRAEAERARHWVVFLSVLPFIEGEPTEKQRRDVCRETLNQVLALKGLDTTAGRFREARELLLHAANDSARREVRRHADAGRYDLAFAVASAHWLDWLPTARVLGPAEVKALDDLRETTRADYKKFGDPPQLAPPPRSREVAPPPRERG